MNTTTAQSGFAQVVQVELFKLKRSLALLVLAAAPSLVCCFLFFNLLRLDTAMAWPMALQSAAAIWAFFMLPMSVTALTALIAQSEHAPRSWEHLRALPLPAWQLYAAKGLCALLAMLAMHLALFAMAPFALWSAGLLNPAAALTEEFEALTFLSLLGRVASSALLLLSVQLWVALRYASFVPALVLGIGGTFFAVVATSARVGIALPWQIPINQLASDPLRAHAALLIGVLGGLVTFALMVAHLSRREPL